MPNKPQPALQPNLHQMRSRDLAPARIGVTRIRAKQHAKMLLLRLQNAVPARIVAPIVHDARGIPRVRVRPDVPIACLVVHRHLLERQVHEEHLHLQPPLRHDDLLVAPPHCRRQARVVAIHVIEQAVAPRRLWKRSAVGRARPRPCEDLPLVALVDDGLHEPVERAFSLSVGYHHRHVEDADEGVRDVPDARGRPCGGPHHPLVHISCAWPEMAEAVERYPRSVREQSHELRIVLVVGVTEVVSNLNFKLSQPSFFICCRGEHVAKACDFVV